MLFELSFQSFGLKGDVSGRRMLIKMGGNKKTVLGIGQATAGLNRTRLSQEVIEEVAALNRGVIWLLTLVD